jgi:hypothetical protein
MSFSRRTFLQTGTVVAITAGFPLKTLVAETLNRPSVLPIISRLNGEPYLDREAFAGCLNTKFTFFHRAIGTTEVKLIEVNDLTPKTFRLATNEKECFALQFIGSSDKPLRQETYAISHESLGNFNMLVVPIAKDKDGVYYEAIFNRLH